MNRRLSFCLASAAVLLLVVAGCDEYYFGHNYLNVFIVSAPDQVAPGQPATFVVTSRSDFASGYQVRMEWGDRFTTMSKPCEPGDTLTFKYAWKEPGNYLVRAVVYLSGRQYYTSRGILVSGPADLVIDSAHFHSRWRPTELTAFARDPGGESLRLAVEWGDGTSETTGYAPSPCLLRTLHHYSGAGFMQVTFRVLNKSGSVSPRETLSGTVSATGEVAKFRLGAYSGSPVVANDIVFLVGEDGIYGMSDSSALYFFPGSFTGQPSVSSQTLHGYIGSEGGYLHAFTQELVPVWQYPAHESITGWQWGPAAVNGNALYVPCSNDSIYCLIDGESSVTRSAAFGAAQVDAVVLDSAGNVYFGSDSGYLFRLTPGLNLVWRTQLQPDGRVLGPVVGAGGIVYCASDSKRIYAVDPIDGAVIWQQTLGAVCHCPVVGSDGLYAATGSGILYKLDLADGHTLWKTRLGIEGLFAAPVLAGGGYLYVQADDSRLYCMEKWTGDSAWVCNVEEYLPRGRRMRHADGISSPTIGPGGRAWVVGDGALYILNTQSELDYASPWPKLQHDLLNTGYAGGGR